MKNISILHIFLVGLFFVQFSKAQSISNIKLVSANIRVALQEDEVKGVGWQNRKEIVFEVIKRQNPDIICLQEVIEIQNTDFKNAFNEFKIIGYEGPEMDLHTDGGYYGIAKNPILFNKSKFELISAGQYWLSETPQIAGSMAWNTARARNANWVRLKEISTGKQFRVINTHLDHKSDLAKENQAKMIVEEANQYQEFFPQILVGDFNSDQESSPIKIIKKYWKDSYGELHNNIDPGFTVHGFIGEKAKTKNGKVDFVFLKGGVSPVKGDIVKEKINGMYPSDHYFITAEFILNEVK